MHEEIESKKSNDVRAGARVQSNSDVVLICPDEVHRRNLTKALVSQHARIVEELTLYPAYNHLLSVVGTDCDAFIIELDTDTEAALSLVETICDRKPSATVMVYSGIQQPDLLVNSMRAGAREFLSGVIAPNNLNDALLRASARRAEMSARKVRGKTLMFWGCKGGCGATTLATNFAIALKKESGAEVALLDLNLNLGEVALLLGLSPRFTLADALASPGRLDTEFVSTLLSKDRSGVSVLAGSDAYRPITTAGSSIGKLVDLVATIFPYVVIDGGPTLATSASGLLQYASEIDVITQPDLPSLRATQRLLTYIDGFGEPNVQIILNRFESRKSQFDDEQIAKTLGSAPRWKVPNDYPAVRRAADTGNPLALEKGPIPDCLRRMAQNACGKAVQAPKKRSLFG